MPRIKECVLPNGQWVFYRSKTDVDLLTRELLHEPIYFRHGVTVRDGDCILDVGANIGFFLLQLGQILKEAVVYSIEPIPEVFEVLRRNAQRHSWLEYHLLNYGLSRNEGATSFKYFPRLSVASTMYPDESRMFRRNSRRFVLTEMRQRSRILRGLLACTPEWLWFPVSESIRRYYQSTRNVTCRLRRLTDVIDEEGITGIDLLKVDTEGAEEDVLSGIEPRHWSLIRQAVIEVHQGRKGLLRIERLLHDQGFTTVSELAVPGVEHLYLVFARRADT